MPMKSLAKQSFFITTAIVLFSSSFLPMASFADGATPADVSNTNSQTCIPPASTQPGVHEPIGADSKTYTYNCTTGLWQNNYYTFDPSTGLTTATYPIVYTYNTSSGDYDTTVWTYDAATGAYVAVTESVTQPPSGSNVIGGPAAVADPSASTISNTGADSNNSLGDGSEGSSISGTGPDSSNGIGGNNTNSLTANNQTGIDADNTLNQDAITGDAAVLANTQAGSATSGNAQSIANVVNMLQSSSNALSGNTVTFVANIDGDVNGDLLIDPSTLSNLQPASSNSGTTNNLTLNNSTNAAINNNINVGANTGNATEAENTNGGDATSGSASAIANVVNLIDSAITSGKSFIGVININGDLNGNIVVPPNLINQLIASNVPTVSISETGPSSTNTISGSNSSNNTTVNNTNNEGINNNINSSAASGSASETANTNGGNATTGDAATNVTAFNLTGSQVVGANDLLVFVNVLGSWVGMIVNAPAGATAAELGGGITSDTNNGSSDTTVNNNNNDDINNNINTNAQSGNADESENTNGGNATSGNADTAVNLLNVENSGLSFSGWFGILFINVLGTWHGDFGIEPSPADTIIPATTSGSSETGSSSTQSGSMKVFKFVPTGTNEPNNASIITSSNTSQNTNGSVLAAHITKGNLTAANNQLPPSRFDDLLFPVIAVVAFILYIIGDRMHAVRQARAKVQKASNKR
jgi:hypothetical protein